MDIATGDVDGDGYTDLATVTNDYAETSSNDVRSLFEEAAAGSLRPLSPPSTRVPGAARPCSRRVTSTATGGPT